MDLITLAGPLLFEELDDDVAVFLIPTRETHLVDRLGANLLARLATGPATRDELRALLAAMLPDHRMTGHEEYLDRSLSGWRDVGLID